MYIRANVRVLSDTAQKSENKTDKLKKPREAFAKFCKLKLDVQSYGSSNDCRLHVRVARTMP